MPLLSKKYNFLIIFLLGLTILFTLLDTAFGESYKNTSVYLLGPEDVVSISILAGGEEQVNKDMVVQTNGHINIPFIGKIKASGLTMEELEKSIIEPLERDYFVAPQVHLQIKEYHSLQFFISGAVKHPGLYELDFIPNIMDLIANAGGVLPERGNLAYILRGVASQNLDPETMEKKLTKTEPIKINLLKLLDEGDMSENVKLKSGDTIYIPLSNKLNQTTTKIYVQGKVKRPGIFDFQPGLTALTACILAGGFDKFAAPNRATVVRQTENGQQTIKINLKKVQTGDLPDIPLKPGDRIHVPESWL
ncbi:MAG: polysaccharide export protein [Desulfobacteraceae bacterium]|nr:polysaccharide export protein [Desulfobacteraceae bacterium]